MSDGPLIVIEESGEVHRLYIPSAVLGRSHTCDLSFDSAGVSRRHCEIVVRPDGLLVRDLGSSHGTFLDGNRVRGESPLLVGQEIRLGSRGPRLRVLDARPGEGAVLVEDEATRAIEPDRTAGIGAVAPTQTAVSAASAPAAPAAPAAPPATVPRAAPAPIPEGTVVSGTPRRAPPAAVPRPVDAPAAASAGSALGDVVLGLLLGIAAGVVLLVAVDLAPVRGALGLD